MKLYRDLILPRLCDWTMGSPAIRQLRMELLAELQGDVLEIGFGTGLNLEHYPKSVSSLAAVDPGAGMNRIARTRIERSGVRVDLRGGRAEELPFEDERFDCVVSTWTLCSIPDVRAAIGEIHRVLKPGARFVFIEHGVSDDPSVQRWQRRLNPIQCRIGGGCRLDLDVESQVRSVPFDQVAIDRFEMEGTPRTHGTTYRGAAVK
jgi:SAM-dependent methyltransferase